MTTPAPLSVSPVRCADCGEVIREGEDVFWSDLDGDLEPLEQAAPMHLDCGGPDVEWSTVDVEESPRCFDPYLEELEEAPSPMALAREKLIEDLLSGKRDLSAEGYDIEIQGDRVVAKKDGIELVRISTDDSIDRTPRYPWHQELDPVSVVIAAPFVGLAWLVGRLASMFKKER